MGKINNAIEMECMEAMRFEGWDNIAKTVIVIGPKQTIEIEECLNSLGHPAYSLTVDGIKSAVSDVGYGYLIENAKAQGFAVFEGV